MFLRCVHSSSSATTTENTMNVTDMSPERLYVLPENMLTNIGKQHPAVIDASDT